MFYQDYISQRQKSFYYIDKQAADAAGRVKYVDARIRQAADKFLSSGDATELDELGKLDSFLSWRVATVRQLVEAERGEAKRLVVSLKGKPVILLSVSEGAEGPEYAQTGEKRYEIHYVELRPEHKGLIGGLVDYAQGDEELHPGFFREPGGQWLALSNEWLHEAEQRELLLAKSQKQAAYLAGLAQDDLADYLQHEARR